MSADRRDPRFDDLPAYALGALDGMERAAVEDLLARSEAAREELAGLLETTSLLALAAPDVEPRLGMKERVLSGIEAAVAPATALSATVRPEAAPAPRGSVGQWLSGLFRGHRPALANTLVGSFAVLSLLLAVIVKQLNDEIQQLRSESRDFVTISMLESMNENGAPVSSQLQAIEDVRQQLQEERWRSYMISTGAFTPAAQFGPAQDSDARGYVLRDETGENAILVVEGLAQLSGDNVYQMWLVREGASHNAGTFHVDAFGYSQVVLSIDTTLFDYTGAVVTVEPAGGSPAPLGERVLEGTAP